MLHEAQGSYSQSWVGIMSTAVILTMYENFADFIWRPRAQCHVSGTVMTIMGRVLPVLRTSFQHILVFQKVNGFMWTPAASSTGETIRIYNPIVSV